MDNCGHSGYGALGKLKKAGKLEIEKGVTTVRQDHPRRVQVDRMVNLRYRKRKTHDKKV